MRKNEMRVKLEELMIALELLHEEIGKKQTDDHNENVRRMAMAVNVEKRLQDIDEKMARIEAGTIERDLMLRDRYNEILSEVNEVKNRMHGMVMEHVELKGLISATNKQIADLREALTETDDAYIADLKAVIAERLAGNGETPLSTVELAELAEAAKKVAEAEDLAARKKTQVRIGGPVVF